MYKNNDTEGIKSSLLPDVYNYISCKKPIFEEDFSMLLNQSILLNRNFLHEYSDIDEKTFKPYKQSFFLRKLLQL